MKFFSMLLDTETTKQTLTEKYEWLGDLTSAVKNVLNPILIVACLVGIIYAIWVGVQFAKADSSDQRKEAKNKLITVIVGVVAAGALVALFYWLTWMINNDKIHFDIKGQVGTSFGGFVQQQLMWIHSFF